MTTEEKIAALVSAIGHARAGLMTELPHWEDDALLAPLTSELQALVRDLQAQLSLSTARQRDFYERILDQLPTDFALMDEHGRYLYMSAFAVRDPALRQWIIGKTDFDFCAYRNIDPELARNRHARHQEALHTGLPAQVLEVRPDRQGRMIHKLRIFVPITGHLGERLVAGYCHDITESVLHEQYLLSKNETLEKVNYELDQFVYRASHDLRAPLSSVQGLLEIALATKTVDEARPYLALMQRSIAKMDGFIRDIVDHSKNARQELQFGEIDLQTSYQETLEQLRFMAGADKVNVTLSVTASAPLISDRFRISILLNNLISNGIKYQDPKKTNPYVEVKAQIKTDLVEFVVRDNGIGIGEEHLNRVFEMFYRATHVAPGTGIGLYIVHEVVRKLGGGVELKSELGVGTEFRVWFVNGVLEA